MEIDKYDYFSFTKIFNFERGKRLIEQEQVKGNIAYISSTKKNNGIDNFITPPDFMKIYNNKMTISNSGSVGYLFYHDYDFVASDHVTVIWLKDKKIILNKNIALYLKIVIEQMKYKYNFGREINNKRLTKEKVRLPIDELGNPNWNKINQMMEFYRRKVEFKNLHSVKQRNNLALDKSGWGKFFLGEIWQEQGDIKKQSQNSSLKVKRGERLIAADRIPGNIAYYSASEYDNGRTDSIANPLFIVKDALIYTTFGDCFYVEGDFTTSDEVSIFRHSKLNKYNGLFIATVINQSKYKYQFGRKAFLNKFKNEYIELPINRVGEIDWIYMEEYIKSIEFAECL